MAEKDIVYSKDPAELLNLHSLEESSLLIVLCESGKMQIEHDGEVNELQKDDMLICHPRFLKTHYTCTPDFASMSALFAPHAMDDILYICMRNIDGFWDKTQFIAKHPIIHINEEQKEIINALVTLIQAYSNKEYNEPLSCMYKLLGQFASLAILSWVDESGTFANHDNQPTIHKDMLLHRFMELLKEQHGVKREVNWYAKQLNITPKYLSVITKSKFNMTAQQMIQQVVCQEIKRQLNDTNYTIKEIAYRMDFSSATFFGKYVRQHWGCTPQELRRRKK